MTTETKRYSACGKHNLTASQAVTKMIAKMVANGTDKAWRETLGETYSDAEYADVFEGYMGMNIGELLEELDVGDYDAVYSIRVTRTA